MLSMSNFDLSNIYRQYSQCEYALHKQLKF